MYSNRWKSSGIALLILAVCPLLAMAGEFSESLDVDGNELQLINLIGEVQILRGSGDKFEIEINVMGGDASRDLITIEKSGGSQNTVRIVFPVENEQHFVYPRMGNSKTTISFNDHEHHGDSFWSKVVGSLKAPRVKVSGKGRGLEVWADVIIRMPKGKDVNVKLGVGEIITKGVEGNVVMDINSGRVSAENVKGSVVGDTGSGSVTFTGIRGKVNADTGSGSVQIEDCEGTVVRADTGSGSVMVKGVSCAKLDIDTGSGRVKALNIKTDAARIDTGSGSIVLELKEMGDGKFVLDTGSGSIDLILPRNASASVSCDTGSGGIDVKLDGVNLGRRDDRDELEFTVGDGAARMILDTGSGGITIRN